MNILDIFKTRQGIIFMSILWGLGLATLFGYSCQNGACIVLKAPKLGEVVKTTYKHDNKCYKFTTEGTTCTAEAIGH